MVQPDSSPVSVLPGPPPAPGSGFKEWSLVCSALGAGAQSIILRKGGIHEGRSGFWWQHGRFFLFPTHFHEQETQFLWTPEEVPTATEPVTTAHTVEFLAEVDFKYQITSWEAAVRLQPFHFWTEETVRARFDYSEATGISLAFLRVHRLVKPWTFADQRNFGGCRSWLDLPSPPENLLWTPVIDTLTHESRRVALREALDLLPGD